MIEPISPMGVAPSEVGLNRNGAPEIRKNHCADKSVAGGDVIVGVFATALVVAIVCYIRITRRRPCQPGEMSFIAVCFSNCIHKFETIYGKIVIFPANNIS
ncbi:hypothetical protein BUALT_Bualt03G0069900 [Buddleja alternifolia]|uniref:Uncharacterized protein n=1 Tax=Buddleja alternifolia TaxID=168488 RepID=A0AAV6XRQ3_9LAMI|nr:hypothetical protein BUALT_Bualt03G0069900 [Buddleja alternifolia]